MKIAVTPRGEGENPGFRHIEDDWSLETGETHTLTIAEHAAAEGKVLASDLTTFIDETDAHRTARISARTTAESNQSVNFPVDINAKLNALLIEDLAELKAITVDRYKSELITRLTT